MPRAGTASIALIASFALLTMLYLSTPTESTAYREVKEHVVDRLPKWDWNPVNISNLPMDSEELLEAPSSEEVDALEETAEVETLKADVTEEEKGEPPEPDVLDSEPAPFEEDDNNYNHLPPPPSMPQEEQDADAAMPRCNRTLLFHLRGRRGFASEFNRLLKVAAIGEYYGYEVVLQQSKWMYGRYENYFTMPKRACSLEGVPDDNRERRPFIQGGLEDVDGAPEWTTHPHVQDGNQLEYTDDLFLRISTEADAVTALHALEVANYPQSLPLSGAETVPKPMWRAFEMEAVQARKWWNLNADVRAMVDSLRDGLGWDDKRDHALLGMHIRLGDKCVETANTKYNPLRFATPEQISAKKAKGHVCSKQAQAGGMDVTHANIYLTAANAAAASVPARPKKPVLAIMSDDVAVIKKLGASQGIVPMFETLLLPERAKEIPEAQGMSGGKDIHALDGGFQPHRFEDLTLKTRIALTRRFIRDLTLLAEAGDAFIFTGSSNVGRLGALLGGLHKARTGRYISCDSRWFGTAYYT